MKIGLYFGSFNPIHIGHLIIANHVLGHSDLDEVWFVVSPQNPLKETKSLLNEFDRLHLVELAIEGNPRFKSCNVEFSMPRPSFTIDTLTYLSEKHTSKEFVVILGSDSIQNIHRWKNYESLLKHYKLCVYARPGFPINQEKFPEIEVLKAPLLEISSTFIRNQLKNGKSIQYLVTDTVKDYILEYGYYMK